ncbi:MAG: sulfotransferase [Gammaproteobacteria bacterium]|nr:sulfotransferase [Gammaproteobacteria bacterium]
MSEANEQTYQIIADLIKQGDAEEALVKLEQLLIKVPNDLTALSMSGSAYMRIGDQAKAFTKFEEAISIDPSSFSAHGDLAFIAMKSGQSSRAITHFEKALEINPKYYPAWSFLEALYFEKRDYVSALSAVKKSEALDPMDQEYKEMQNALKNGYHGNAEKIARTMIERHPGHPRASFMLGHLASRLGAHEECTKILRYALQHHPANMMLRKALIQNLERLGEFILAVDETEGLTTLDSDYRHWILLSKVYGHIGSHEDALKAAEEAAKNIHNNTEELGKVDLLRGHTLKVLGRRSESEQAYRDCIVNTPGNGAGWWGLADFKNYEFDEADKLSMQVIFENERYEPAQRCQAAFALAKAYEGDNDFNESFAWYKKANDLRPNLNFNQEDHKIFCEGIIEGFDSDTLQNQAIKQDGKPIPIFIIGMPRSGSTLIEQILSSHSKIEGTMELMTLPNLERKMIISGGQNFDKKYPESFKYFNKEQLSDFGQEYLNQTSIYRTDKPYFIDKLPPNFERVGVIHKILPNAIIIDARRHPLACGFSIYKQHFAGGYEFSYDLENIGHYYNSYLSVMDHFNQALPDRIFLAQYEDNIRDIEQMTRRLLDYIKLEFESSCLEFYKNKRPVRTASSEQVRQPIYTQSIEAWKQYESKLEPLKKALGPTTLSRFN